MTTTLPAGTPVVWHAARNTQRAATVARPYCAHDLGRCLPILVDGIERHARIVDLEPVLDACSQCATVDCVRHLTAGMVLTLRYRPELVDGDPVDVVHVTEADEVGFTVVDREGEEWSVFWREVDRGDLVIER